MPSNNSDQTDTIVYYNGSPKHKYKWYKAAKEQDAEKQKTQLTTMKQ